MLDTGVLLQKTTDDLRDFDRIMLTGILDYEKKSEGLVLGCGFFSEC